MWNGQQACALQAALRMSNDTFASHLGIGVRTVASWHDKPELTPRPEMQQVLDTALENATDSVKTRLAILLGESQVTAPVQSSATPDTPLKVAEHNDYIDQLETGEQEVTIPCRTADGRIIFVNTSRRSFLRSAGGVALITAVSTPLLDTLNEVRARADTLLDTQSLSTASLEYWEETADYYGFLELNTAPDVFLTQLARDFGAVQNILKQASAPICTQQRLYRVMGQMSGLIAVVSNDVGWDSRPWFHTAHRAAEEINDRALAAWAMAHQSMTYLWNGRPLEKAVELSQAAQEAAAPLPARLAAWPQ